LNENCIGLEGYKNKNVVMNQKYVFFQDETEITFLELNKPWKKENIETVGIMTICKNVFDEELYDNGFIKEV